VRVCIPIPFRPEGGGQYFLQLFRRYLSAHGHDIVDDVEVQYDVLFTNHWVVPLATVLRGLRHNPDARLVQRVDGVAADYGRSGNADRRQAAVNLLADVTIFQSEYSRWAARTAYRVIRRDGPVIFNPVDVDRFRPDGDRLPLPGSIRVACVSWSTNARKGANEVYAVARKNLDVSFYLCGRFRDLPSESRNLHHLGVLGRESLASVLRSCHVLLTFSRNEACPNHVLEALATGRPVLYVDSGASKELVGPCGLSVRPETFRHALLEIHDDWDSWCVLARERAMTMFHPEQIFPRYLEAIQAALERPTSCDRRIRALCASLGPALVPLRRWGWA
jgi:glycosyltransferase involved in cell wall biosynthesis